MTSLVYTERVAFPISIIGTTENCNLVVPKQLSILLKLILAQNNATCKYRTALSQTHCIRNRQRYVSVVSLVCWPVVKPITRQRWTTKTIMFASMSRSAEVRGMTADKHFTRQEECSLNFSVHPKCAPWLKSKDSFAEVTPCRKSKPGCRPKYNYPTREDLYDKPQRHLAQIWWVWQ